MKRSKIQSKGEEIPYLSDPPDAERGMAKRANAEVTEIKSSQAVYIIHASEVAKVIEKAASGS